MMVFGLYIFSLVFFFLGSAAGVYHLMRYQLPGDLSRLALVIYLTGVVGLVAVTFYLVFIS